MKKLLAVIFTLGLVLTLSACDLDFDDMAENKTPANGVSSESVIGQESVDTNASSNTVAELKTREEAIEIALNHAGFKQNEVINLTAELDREMAWSEWEVEFDKDNYEYSYEINATTGEIIKNNKEID